MGFKVKGYIMAQSALKLRKRLQIKSEELETLKHLHIKTLVEFAQATDQLTHFKK
jgi:hypothetical protein